MRAGGRGGRSRLVAIVLALGAGGVVAGCNWIVGAGDYVVVADAAAPDGMVSPLTDSAVPTDGGGGRMDATVAEGGSTTDAAADGTAGDGSNAVPESGPGEAGPLPCGSTLPVSSAAFQQLVNACVLAVTCDPAFFPVTVSDCIARDYLQAFGSLACLSNIKTCTDYYSCQGKRIATAVECSTSASLDVGTCDTTNNNIATSCFAGGQGTVLNCNQLGGTCTVYSTDSTGDTAASCQVLPSCTVTDGGLQCSTSTQIYTCTGGVGYGTNCPNASTCGTIGGSTSCYFNAPSCPTLGSTCTAAGVLDECAVGLSASANQDLQFNCAASGLRCMADDAGAGSCTAPGCAASSCTEGCAADGHTMNLCVGDAPYNAYDCAAHGFTSCTTATDSTSGNTYAFCQ